MCVAECDYFCDKVERRGAQATANLRVHLNLISLPGDECVVVSRIATGFEKGLEEKQTIRGRRQRTLVRAQLR